jgi:Zn-dependent protease with chaperone function
MKNRHTLTARKISLFEIIFSLFLLIFGVTTICSLIIFFIYFIYASGFFLLIFLWPIAVGLAIGIFKSNIKPFEIEINERDNPKLKEVIDDLIQKTGMKRPTKIVLKENSQVAVTGFFRKKIIIGMVSLKFLEKEELVCILAHEYGHFAHRDTLIGYFIWRIEYFFDVQEKFNKSSLNFDLMAIIYCPTFCFFWLLNNFFKLTSLWYSRRIELRADSFAARIVGKQEYANAFMKYVSMSEIFERVVPQHIIRYLREGLVIKNIYAYLTPVYTEENIRTALEISLSRKSGFFDSHPSESERLENIRISEINLIFKNNLSNLLHNQEKLEEKESELFTQKMTNIIPLSFRYQG